MRKERIFLIILVSILVIIWFKKGLIIGSGESGLPFYNTPKLLEVLKSSWSDVPLGTSSAVGYASYPLYLAIIFLQNLGIPSFIIQAFIYWALLVVGTLSIHKIASLIPDNSPLTRLSSSLFYIFNPIVHVAVLHRLQYPLTFFYSFLPFAFIIYLIGLRSKKIIYLLLLGLTSVIFSFSFVGIESIEILFGVLGLLSLTIFLSNLKQKREWFPLFYFVGFVLIFSLLNAWWVTPLISSYVDIGTGGAVKYFSPADNAVVFDGISIQMESVLSVFRFFKPNDFSIESSPWAWIYSTQPFIVLSFIFIGLFILGIFKKKKDLLFKLLILISLLALFWTKGPLRPLGGINLSIFNTFTFLQVFRNPLEKAGIILPFAMAIPLGFGLAMVINYLSNKIRIPKKIVALIILILIFPVYMFPITTGLTFTGGGPPANNPDIGQYVKVPAYYQDAREWLDKQQGLFRVLVLPLDGEGMTYKWDYGFSGVELSNNIFNQSMISFNTSQAFLPEMIDAIKSTLKEHPEYMRFLAQLLNVRYIMLRDDIDYAARETESPASDLSLIRRKMSSSFTPVADFGKLKFFELNSAEFRPKISANVSPVYLFDPLGKSISMMPFSNPSLQDIFITTAKSPEEDPYINLAKKIVIKGVKVENININTDNPIEVLPFVSIYRDAPYYALIRLKEELQSQFLTPDTQLSFQVNLAGKRLVEINHSPQDRQAIDEYSQMVKSIGQEVVSKPTADRIIAELLLSQRQVLEEVRQKTADKDKIDQIISYLDSLFIYIGAKSAYPTQKSLIYRFYVPRDSKYEVLVAKEDWNHYFEDIGIPEFDLDGKTIKGSSLKENNNENAFSFGIYSLNKGVHEVSVSSFKTVNLIEEKLPEELVLSSVARQPFIRTIPISSLNSNYSYLLSFEYIEEKGNVPVIALTSDVDPIDKDGNKIPRLGIALARDNYDFGWKKYSAQFTPAPTANKYELSVKIIPYGDCKSIVQRPFRRYCEDNRFNQRYLQDSTAKIRNLKIEKIFLDPIVLRESDTPSKQQVVPQLTFDKISPARYKVQVTDAKNPFFLVLSTSFDPRWNAYLVNTQPKSIMESLSDSVNGDVVSSANHFVANGYANGWYIEKEGNYEMFLEYSPERIFVIGRKLTVFIITILLLIFTLYLARVKFTGKRNLN